MRPRQFQLLTLVLISTGIFSCHRKQKSHDAGLKMKEFVINISDYAKNLDPSFLILSQNGTELAFDNLNSDNGIDSNFISAIDGMGVEEIFTNQNGRVETDEYRLGQLRKISESVPVMVSEFVKDDGDASDVYQKNLDEGFLCFVRDADNYYYNHIPPIRSGESADHIVTLPQAKNYLYVIGVDSEKYTKDEFVSALDETNYDVIIFDLFYTKEIAFSPADVALLKTKANGGQRLVLSYMNIGAAEKYRYYFQDDWKLHNPEWLKKRYAGYPDEFWVEFWNPEWQNIIYGNDSSYLKKIMDAGFDGAYLDNVEAYYSLYY